ncbi:MAG: polysaccharide pyruvyl transferase family protein [Candidatus Bipolaricaulis sp.]|nr:polysaccharide pyruvyl transferase family protein [Candidatus Bipolaricaulis sp.]
MMKGAGAGRDLRVLAVGYSGANNTGAEALLRADVDDLRAVLGPGAAITVPSLNVRNLRRYLSEGAGLSIVRMPTVFFAAVWRLVRRHDVVILVEGSTFMDTWGSPLLWYFLWAAWCAHRFGKPCLAYAVDAGELCARNRYLTGRVASRMDRVVVRARAAADRLRACGVTAPIEITADNALTFVPDAADACIVPERWPEAAGGVVGLAAVNYHLFPVRVRPLARRADRYRWPFAFSRSRERSRAAAALAAMYAELADWIVEEQRRSVALLCMEELDEPFAVSIRERMRHPEQARVFSSRVYNASQMTSLLRSLELLVTSRYHAAVLSLGASVPQMAVGHDLRLRSLYGEIGLSNVFFEPGTPDLIGVLKGGIRDLLADPQPTKAILRCGHEELAARARQNREHLKAFFARWGWCA